METQIMEHYHIDVQPEYLKTTTNYDGTSLPISAEILTDVDEEVTFPSDKVATAHSSMLSWLPERWPTYTI